VAFEHQEAFAARGFRAAAELAMARFGLPACITNPDLVVSEVSKEAPEDDYRRLRMRLFEGVGYAPDESRQLYAIARDRGAVLGVHDFVGYYRGRPAGTISLWPRGRFASIGDVATMPEFRNRGVARTMLFDVSKRAINEGCEYSLLFTDLVDSPQVMYKGLGYQPVGELRSFLKVGVRAPAGPAEAS
jgi:GNAT superfamily N-acetyltransferase